MGSRKQVMDHPPHPSSKTEWSGRRRPDASKIIGTIVLPIKIVLEDKVYVGYCPTFDVSSFGSTIEEALDSTLEAVEVYLEAIDDVNERERVFAEKGVLFFPGEPPPDVEMPTMTHPGDIVTTQRISVLAGH